MDIAQAGIWSVFDSHTCCGRIAHNFIVIYGRRHWLCALRLNAHMETRGFLRMDGELVPKSTFSTAGE